MNARLHGMATTSLLVALTLSPSAQAEYRCDPPPSRIDRNACAAAQQGPSALRQYVQRMRPFGSLRAADYVDRATVLAWEASGVREVTDIDRPEGATIADAAKDERR